MQVPTVNFGQTQTEQTIQGVTQQPEVETTKYSTGEFFSDVNKIKTAKGLGDEEAMQTALSYYKSKGYEIDGVNIDEEINYIDSMKEEPEGFLEETKEALTGRVEQIKDIFGRKKQELEQRQQDIKKVAEEEGFGSALLTSVKQAFSDVSNIVKQPGLVGPVGEGLYQTTGQVAGAVGDTLWEVLENTAQFLLPEEVEQSIEQGIKNITDNETLQAIGQGYTEWRENNIDKARNLEATVNIASLLPIGAGTKTLKPVGEAATKVGKKLGEKIVKAPVEGLKSTFRQVYKINEDTVKAAFKDPEKFAIAQKMGGENYLRETADEVVDMIRKRSDDLSELGKEYKTVRKGAIVANEADLSDIFLRTAEKFETKELSKADSKVLKELSEYIDGYKGGLTDKNLLSLRKQIDSVKFDPSTGVERKLTPTGNLLYSEVRKGIDDLAKEKIKGLKELDAKFSPQIQELQKLKKIIYTAKGELKDTYIKDISNLVGKGKELKIERIEKYIPDIREKVNTYKALQDIDNAVSGFKVGTYQSAGASAVAAGLGAVLGGPAGAIVGAIVYQIVANPKLGIEIIKKLGLATKTASSIIKKIKEGVKLSKAESIELGEKIRENLKDIPQTSTIKE